MRTRCLVLVPKIPSLKRKRHYRELGERIFQYYAIQMDDFRDIEKYPVLYDYDYYYPVNVVDDVKEVTEEIYEKELKEYEGLSRPRIGTVILEDKRIEPPFILRVIFPDLVWLIYTLNLQGEDRDFLIELAHKCKTICPDIIGNFYAVYITYHA